MIVIKFHHDSKELEKMINALSSTHDVVSIYGMNAKHWAWLKEKEEPKAKAKSSKGEK